MRYQFKQIVGLDELKSKLAQQGVNVTDIDINIAEVIFQLTDSCVKRGYQDLDGIEVYPVEGFIYNSQVATLMKSFPNATALLAGLDRKNNYGFIEENGNVYRTGMMGDIDPIMEVKGMVEAYAGTRPKRPQLFASEEEYQEYKQNYSSYKSGRSGR